MVWIKGNPLTVGENANWYKQYVEQYGDSFKKKEKTRGKKTTMTE